MPDFPRVTSRALTTLLLGATTAALAQQPGPNPSVRHLIGLENIKSNATGKLSQEALRSLAATPTKSATVA